MAMALSSPPSTSFIPDIRVAPSLSSPPLTQNLRAATHLRPSLLERRGCPALQGVVAFHTGPGSGKSSSVSLYQVLQIPQTATQSEIKASYRRLALVYHPDAQAGAAATLSGKEDSTKLFLQIREAYSMLSDDRSRARYDVLLASQTLQGRMGRTRRSPGAPGSARIGRNWESDQCW